MVLMCGTWLIDEQWVKSQKGRHAWVNAVFFMWESDIKGISLDLLQIGISNNF